MRIMRKVPNVREYVPRFTAYLRENCVWGSLHVVLEDGNVGDSSVDYCIESAVAKGDTEGEALARILRDMSRTQRSKLDRLCQEALKA